MKSANVKKEGTGFQLNADVQQKPFSSVSHPHFNHRLNISDSHTSVFFYSPVRGLVTATVKILKPFILVGRKVFCNRRFEALWIFFFFFQLHSRLLIIQGISRNAQSSGVKEDV